MTLRVPSLEQHGRSTSALQADAEPEVIDPEKIGCSSINKSEARTCCRLKCICGPDLNVMFGSIILISWAGLTSIFYASPSVVASILEGCLLFLTMYCLIRCGTTDPGYLPKQPPPPDSDIARDRNVVEIIRIPSKRKGEEGQYREYRVERSTQATEDQPLQLLPCMR